MSETQADKQAQEDAAQQEFLRRAKEPQRKFKISKQQLIDIAAACQERQFAEEIELIKHLGGDEWLYNGLITSKDKGISGDPQDLEDRDFAFQNNEKPQIKMKGILELFLDALEDLTLRILMVSSCVSMLVEILVNLGTDKVKTAWIEGFAIMVAVLVVSTVTAVNDYQKERQFQELNNVADDRKVVTVFRNGVNQTIHMSKVMVGDLVILTEGMEIPADGYLIQSAELTTDESAMTGETDPVKKAPIADCIKKMETIIMEGEKNSVGKHGVPSNIIMSGTRILTGEGKMIIIVVGDSSCVGKISALLRQNDPEETPLQSKLTKIAEDIGRAGLYASIIILIILLIRFAIERIIQNTFDDSIHVPELFHFLILAITVVVVSVPEGLPLAVTLSLAYSVKKMLKDQNLVRKMQACETMGGANNICSDKTGTLTKNLMTLTTWWNAEYQEFDYENKNNNLDDYMSKEFQPYFIHNCALNSSAQLRPDEKGSKTEVAILQSLEGFNLRYDEIRANYNDETCKKIPFSSKRKRMSCIVDLGNGKKRIYVKGASEMVLRSCNKFHNKKTNQIVPLDAGLVEEVNKNIKRMADNALRTICLAYRDLNGNEDMHKIDEFGVYQIENVELTLMGVFGIADVIRAEVPGAIDTCQKAGITVRMVTGDNIDTARAIALKCNLISKDDKDALVMEGSEFIRRTGGVVCKRCRILVCDCPRDRESAKKAGKPVRVDTIKDAEAFDAIYPKLYVMARSRPEDKYALVTGLIERHNVVAVTGDGTNDAPALKKADVGFAMGIAGTEVARQAADIILLDDNFKSIVAAVLWGRNIYDCIKKFLQFQLTVNVVAVFITLIGAAIIKQEVVSPIQLLWLNLIMDTLASLALATEPPQEALLKKKPHNRHEYIVSQKMCKHIIMQVIYQLTVLCIFTFAGEFIIPEERDKFFLKDIVLEFRDRVLTTDQDDPIWTHSKWEDSNTKTRFDIKPWPDTLTPPGLTQDNALTDYGDVSTVFTLLKAGNDYDSIVSDNNDDLIDQLDEFFYRVRYHEWKAEEQKTIVSGREKSYSGLSDEYEITLEIFDVYSRHFTFMFNLFVIMQMFNFINARKVYDEFNTFDGISRNPLFLGIIVFVVCAQAVIVTFGGFAFNCYKYYGLNGPQWGICIAFGVLGNFWNLVIKLIDEKKLIRFNLGWGDKAEKDSEEDEEDQEGEGAGNDQNKNNQTDAAKDKKVEAKQQITDDQLNNLPKNKKKLDPLIPIDHHKKEQNLEMKQNVGPQE